MLLQPLRLRRLPFALFLENTRVVLKPVPARGPWRFNCIEEAEHVGGNPRATENFFWGLPPATGNFYTPRYLAEVDRNPPLVDDPEKPSATWGGKAVIPAGRIGLRRSHVRRNRSGQW